MICTERLSKRFGAVTALEELSLDIAAGEFFALLGASGSGKTTLLRLLGGFEAPSSGRILIDGQDVTDLGPHRRPTNTVFQSYALFPHLTLAENVGYGLLNHPLSRGEREARATQALARVHLEGLGRRYPHQISGGQRQRVALARALICEPKVLLLDEPLSALDKRLREEMQMELREIQRVVGITFILVTHDQEEAMLLADRVAVMSRGRLLQIDTPRRLYEAPVSREVAEFISNVNLLEGICIGRNGAEVSVEIPELGRFHAFSESVRPQPGEAVTLAIRPEKVVIGAVAGFNALAGHVMSESYAGDRTILAVRVAGHKRPFLVTQPNVTRCLSPEVTSADLILSWSPGAAAVLHS